MCNHVSSQYKNPTQFTPASTGNAGHIWQMFLIKKNHYKEMKAIKKETKTLPGDEMRVHFNRVVS